MDKKESQNIIKEIARLVARSDRGAFGLLYDHYWHSIYKTAYRYLKSSSLAEDVVQDIFMKLWVKRETLGEVNNLDDYIFIIARNEIVSTLRKQNKLTLVSVEDPVLDDIPETIHNTLVLKETEILINQAVNQLPPQQRKVFLLTRRNGLSHAEIGSLLKINARTVNNHITRALHSIQQYLKEQHNN